MLMIISDLFQILNEKAMEYTDVLNAPLDKVQQDFDQQLLSKSLNVTVCKRYGFFSVLAAIIRENSDKRPWIEKGGGFIFRSST